MVIWVTENEQEDFAPLIDERLRDSVRLGKLLCLGGIVEEDGTQTAAGAIVFAPRTYWDKRSPSLKVELRWLFVAEPCRKKGIASELLEAMADTMTGSGTDTVCCDIPADESHEEIVAFLAARGFSFAPAHVRDICITKEDCRRLWEGADEKKVVRFRQLVSQVEGLLPVGDVPKRGFAEAVQAMKRAEKSGFYDKVSENRDAFQQDMSFVIAKDGKISSMILFERARGKELVLAMTAGISEDAAMELIALVEHALQQFYSTYPEDAFISIRGEREKTRKVVRRMFPGKLDETVKRGEWVF